jgi:hypothetical protein
LTPDDDAQSAQEEMLDNEAGEEEQREKPEDGDPENKAGEEEQKSEDDETKQEENPDPEAEPPAPIDVEGESTRVIPLLRAKKRNVQRRIKEYLEHCRQCIVRLCLPGRGWKRDRETSQCPQALPTHPLFFDK